jgi:hypothetical protein
MMTLALTPLWASLVMNERRPLWDEPPVVILGGCFASRPQRILSAYLQSSQTSSPSRLLPEAAIVAAKITYGGTDTTDKNSPLS